MSILPIPPKIKRKSATVLEPTGSRATEFELGRAEAATGQEVIMEEYRIENNAGETLVAYRKTVTLTSDTVGSEASTIKEYNLVGGSLTEIV